MFSTHLKTIVIKSLSRTSKFGIGRYGALSTSVIHRSVEATNSPHIEFNNEQFQKYLESLRQEFYDIRVNAGNDSKAYNRMIELDGVVKALEQHRVLEGNLVSKAMLEEEKDEDMRQLMKEENDVYSGLLKKTEQDLMLQLLNISNDEFYPSLIFEIKSGAGGQEAMLFAKELLEMYTNFFDLNGWEYEIIEEDCSDIGGLRHANIVLDSPEAYTYMKHEAGVHRVQRVPVTEKSGRMHTSTVSVSVIPRPADVQITIAEKDLKIDTKRASGAGGQHVNTTDSAVRILHIPSGISIECQTERSQIKNREIALKRLHNKLLRLEIENADAQTKATRKSQQGNLDRNEKIRTYNFVQDRVTDHRLQGNTIHNIKEFMEGGEHLGKFMDNLITQFRKQKLGEMISNWESKVEDKIVKSKIKANK